MKILQLPSRYFKEEGMFKIEYTVVLDTWYLKFTNIPILLEDALGEGVSVKVSEDGKTLRWVEVTSNRAVKWSEVELSRIFKDCVVDKNPTWRIK
jgi:hypothetical protein